MMQRAAAAALLVLTTCARPVPATVEASSTLYVRSDDNDTRIISPRTHVETTIDEHAALSATHTIDAWTGASIDVTTAATEAIRETRHDLGVGAGYVGRDVRLHANYRYSFEPDYRSHGAVLRGEVDLLRDNTTLALALVGSHDIVGRAGDPFFRSPQATLGGQLTWTQVLGRRSLMALAWETLRVSGFQASPYRFVAIGGDGTCASLAPYCVPESAPQLRYRNAASLRARRAFGKHVSLGGEYRFYFDSWGLLAHTLGADITLLPTRRDTLELQYRYHTQSEADFYRPRYFDLETTAWVTRDRKLSTLYTHELSLMWLHDFHGLDASVAVSAGVRLTTTHIRYLAFVGLERVGALASTLMLQVRFE